RKAGVLHTPQKKHSHRILPIGHPPNSVFLSSVASGHTPSEVLHAHFTETSMPTPRRITHLLLGCALALPLTTLQAQAADPNIRILVGYAPGGAVDTVARVVADAMRDSGYQVIV